MPDIPIWLIEILRQFPMVVVIGFGLWYIDKRGREKEIRLEKRYDEYVKVVDEREEKLRKEARADRDAEIKRSQDAQKMLTKAYEKAITAKDEQIANLTKQLDKLN
ncbi:MAG TPA: hypothetical protein VG097_18350 [Gemmata sp.]|nr:hypothetical protein [Gemmata sp.]